MSLKRKIQKAKKKKAEKELKDKVMSFDRMPDCCVMCYKDFDKTSKEHHNTWIVVERREQKRVSLFCPDCWDNGLAAAKEHVYKKQTALDRHLIKKEDPKKRRNKVVPDSQDYPEVEDYIKKGTPKVKVPKEGETKDE
jgi:hypothetical protein|tara:strand:- start:25572 stop:25985 length:414 start_codon:yes stop_codon:yes gene_type:complete